MTNKEKKQKALEIYQQLINSLEEVEDKEQVIDVVNELIEENGLSPNGEGSAALRSTRSNFKNNNSSIICPKCGSSNFVKNGSAHGKPRFRCKECSSFFGPTSGKITDGTSSSSNKWDKYIEGMLCNDSLTILSEKCNISLSTAHSWRMKVLTHVANSKAGEILSGIIQEDEFYLPSSFKGNWKGPLNLGIEKDYSNTIPDYQKYGFRDYSHKRGSQDTKRGLSNDKVCVATAIDESKRVIGKPIGRGNVSSTGLEKAFTSRFNEQAILVTDKSRGGVKFAQNSGLAHFALDSKTESRKGRYNLQLINALHSIIAEKTHSRSSFATKNAELYITWEAWKLFNKNKSLEEKKSILSLLVVPGQKTVTNKEIRNKQFPQALQK